MQSRTLRAAGGVFLLIVLGALAFGAVAPLEWRRQIVTHGPPCPFRWFTGLVCPFCGMTRATLLWGAGDVVGALAMHPLSPLVLFLTLWGSIQLLRGRPLHFRGHPLEAKWLLWGVALAWAVNLLYEPFRPTF